jgi:hypothetical protein
MKNIDVISKKVSLVVTKSSLLAAIGYAIDLIISYTNENISTAIRNSAA